MSRRVAMTFVAILAGAVLAGSQQPAAELPDLERTGVVVPWEDFKLILEEIRRPQPTPVVPPPPVDFALSECVATAVVSGDEQQLRVNLIFTVEVLNDERWVEVPVIGEGVALASVRMDGAPARLYRKNGAHTIALEGAGRHQFSVDYLVRVQDSRGTRTARMRFPPAPVVAVDLRVPRGDVDLQVDGAVVQSLARSAGTRGSAAGGRHSGELVQEGRNRGPGVEGLRRAGDAGVHRRGRAARRHNGLLHHPRSRGRHLQA